MEAKLIWSNLKELNEDNINSNTHNRAGVYRLSYREEADDNYYVFFVGSTSDLKGELLKHCKKSDNECVAIKVQINKCAYRCAESDDEKVRNSATKQAYRHYQPPCNMTEPIGDDDVIVNLS
jgi:hypothetical protein